ncbi:MAG: metallophosphoesterase family protein [Rhodospirillaceae bacterium]
MNILSRRDSDRLRMALAPARDLGRLDGTVLAFGGPYSNLQALQAMRAQAGELGIPPERCICTGDVVAYGADPAASVASIREGGAQVIAGNCELALADAAFDCGCGFQAGSACDVDAARWYAFARRQTDAGARRWMAALPGMIRLTLAGRRVAVVHGAPSRVNRFVFASTPATEKLAEMNLAGAELVIAGHAGLPFTETLAGGAIWHNPGAIGLPANDGTPDGWYALLRPTTDGGLAISHHHLAYDHAEAARRMRAAGLPEGYARALETGLWPSDDVLPETEKAAAGIAIDAGRLQVPA